MTPLVCVLLFFAMTGHSSGTYCLCKDGVGDKALQGALDYACGHGADCSAIQPSGACYNPNTVKDHCSYAVNSYFHKLCFFWLCYTQFHSSCQLTSLTFPSFNISFFPPNYCLVGIIFFAVSADIAPTCTYTSSSGNSSSSSSSSGSTSTFNGTTPTTWSAGSGFVPSGSTAIFFAFLITLWIVT
ncbi:hypothetical protein GQ457_03G026890 [Hibiscus cannabinus]